MLSRDMEDKFFKRTQIAFLEVKAMSEMKIGGINRVDIAKEESSELEDIAKKRKSYPKVLVLELNITHTKYEVNHIT